MPDNMQSRRRILIISAVLLTAGVLALLFKPWDFLQGSSGKISMKQIDKVDRIVLSDSYNTTELNLSSGQWLLFGSEELNAVSVENLLFAAGRLDVVSITEREVFEEASGPGTDIRDVQFFRGNKILSQFSMLGASGRYLVLPSGSDRAFYVSIPGYPELDLERVFSATPDHYREHLLIDLRPSDIHSIEIELSGEEAFRFDQDREGNITCKGINETSGLPEGAPDELAMKRLFSYFTSIRYEQVAGIPADSLLKRGGAYQKMATIRLESFSGEHHSLQVFPYYTSPVSEPHLFKALVLYKQEQEALLVNYIYLDVLMRGLSHYIGEK